MSNADLVAEAIHTVYRLGWALVGWIAVLAFVATVILLAGTAVGMWATRTAWRAMSGPSWRRGRVRARILARTRARGSQRRTRHRWAHSQPIDDHEFEEAA